jgi:hypothetical protein
MFSGVLGYGLPAACGVALAERDLGTNRKVISLQGDGATQYGIQAFWNAAQLKLPILFIIFRNHEYCILKSFSEYLVAPNVPGFDLPGIDTVATCQGIWMQRRLRFEACRVGGGNRERAQSDRPLCAPSRSRCPSLCSRSACRLWS